jgi:pyruvate-formate lyase-activating enzyme
MKSERYEPKQYIESAKESCHYCHNVTLQQVGNEKCALTVARGSTARRD